MKLDEFDKISDYRTALTGQWEMPIQLIKFLREKGYKRMGSGSYSSVYGRPGEDVLVKIGIREADLDGYVGFAELARQTRNPHFPHVGKVRWLKNRHGKAFYVLPIERLYAVSHEESAIIEKGGFLIRLLMKRHSFANVRDLEDALVDRYSNQPGADVTLAFVKDNPSLVEALMMILREFPDRFMDLQHDNIMKRRDGTIVFNDPVA